MAIAPNPMTILRPNQTARNPSTLELLQRLYQRKRGHARRRFGVAAPEREKTAMLEGKANGRRHHARHRCGRADHRRDLMLMRHEMRECARRWQ